VSFVYLISNGALDWGPLNRARRLQSPMVSAGRTTRTTVRRVGLEGRAEPGGAPADQPDATPAEVH
jgi:NADH-quinone oxidoreductase subunit A